MKWITFILVLMSLMLTSLVAIAQEPYPEIEFIAEGVNDPRVNPIANACYFGGTLSGLCNTTDVNGDKVINALDRDWMWNAGWHLIRFEYNVFTREEIEPAYASIIPLDFVHRIAGKSGCYGVVYEGIVGAYILWPGGTKVQTVRLYENDECINESRRIENIIAIETDELADAACKEALGENYAAQRFYRSFYECVSTLPPSFP